MNDRLPFRLPDSCHERHADFKAAQKTEQDFWGQIQYVTEMLVSKILFRSPKR